MKKQRPEQHPEFPLYHLSLPLSVEYFLSHVLRLLSPVYTWAGNTGTTHSPQWHRTESSTFDDSRVRVPCPGM